MSSGKFIRLAQLVLLTSALGEGVAAQEISFKPDIKRGEIRFEIQGNHSRGIFTSRSVAVPIEAAEPFLAVGAVLIGDVNNDARILISLRGSVDGSSWSDWREFEADHDSMSRVGEYIGGLILLDRRTKLVQYRITVEKGTSGFSPAVTDLKLSFISPGVTPKELQVRMLKRTGETMNAINQPPTTKYPRPPVVTRTEWGCPDGQITTHGALSYTTVTHLIVHHTATGNEATDWAAVVRSIWNFHIFSNGWADVGYNYLIDPNGVIYEGRAGGDNVLGAHFSGVNAGTMGVAMLGTFTDVAPATRALNGLKKILAWKADQRNLDPIGASLHAASRLDLKVISGHRDGPGSTECPGDSLHPLLPAIRADVKNLLSNAGAVAGVSAASFRSSALASESIVALFGASLASSTQIAASAPLPVSLGGTTVTVRDSANNEKLAPLFFVSEGQINFLMPSGLANGEAAIIAANPDGHVARGIAGIAPVAPAMFSANANGHEVAAAVILRVKADGSQSYEPVATFDRAQNKFVAAPIDLGPDLGNASDQVFLVAYGTGIRFRSSLGSVTAKIGGVDSQVLFAGPASGFFGLDQVNVRLPRNLIGRGEVDFDLVADGQAANVLKLRIK